MHRLFALLLLAGCTRATFAWTPSSGKPTSPKPDTCVVEVVTSQPSKDYENLGSLDFYNGDEPKNVDQFKKAVSKQVCEAGGDAVIAIADDKGRYTKGTVIHYVPKMAEPVAPTSKPEAKPEPPPQAEDKEAPPTKKKK